MKSSDCHDGMRRRLATACAAVTLPIVAGCASPSVVPTSLACDFRSVAAQGGYAGPEAAALDAETSGSLVPLALDTVSLTDPAITNKVLVQKVFASRTPTGTVGITVRFANCTDFPLQVEGRTHFMAGDQSPTEPISAWKRVHLPPRALGSYIENSTNADQVAHYLVEIREGR